MTGARAGGGRLSSLAGASTSAAAAAAGGSSAIAQLDELFKNLPDTNANLRLQAGLLAKHRDRKRADAARAAARQQVEEEAAEDAVEEAAARKATDTLQALREKLTLGVNLDEMREHEAVLAALPMRDTADDFDMDLEYLEALSAAAAELGLSDELGLGVSEQEAFRCGLRSGFVRTLALQRGTAGRPLVSSLLATMTLSPDAETAGAAFVTLMSLMGDDVCSSTSGGSGAAPAEAGSGPAAAATAGQLLDAAVWGMPRVGGGQQAQQAQQGGCQLDCVPTDEELLAALRDNGYHPEGVPVVPGGSTAGSTGGSLAGTRGGLQQQQQAAGQEQQQEAQLPVVRVQVVKLIMHTAAAVCRYCRKHPEAAAGALSREGVCDLLLAALHMCLDPAANQLQEQLDAAILELLGALDEADWQRKLPQLADRVAEMGPSHRLRLRLLHKLPSAHPRGLALCQFAGALLLERLLPAGSKYGWAAGKSSINRRDAAAVDPSAVIAAQPWFSNAKGLVESAASGGAQPPRGGYAIGTIELLLKVCHLLLWPHMLNFVAEEPSCMGEAFLASWQTFLPGIQKNIKNMQPEDQNVKVLATNMDLDYQMMAEGMPLHGDVVML